MCLRTTLWLGFGLFAISAFVDQTNGFLMGLMALACLVGIFILNRSRPRVHKNTP